MKESLFKGYRMTEDKFDGRDYLVVEPETAAEGRPWVWRAEFFSAFDSVDMALAEKGWHIAYYCVSDMYGCPESIELLKAFHDFIVKKCNFSEKADIFGFSRGGLYTVNYAAKYPEDVSTIYLDAPVLDIRSWPGGVGASVPCLTEWKDCKRWYKLTDVKSVIEFNRNPLDRINELIDAKIPVALCAGDSDRAVPYNENGAIFDKKYRELGGDIITIVKPGCDHHPHSIEHPEPIVNFITAHKK